MDMEISVPGSGFGEDGMSVASVEVVAGAKVCSLPNTNLVLTHLWLVKCQTSFCQ